MRTKAPDHSIARAIRENAQAHVEVLALRQDFGALGRRIDVMLAQARAIRRYVAPPALRAER